ncbi:MAG TPA: SLC13 family permease, partial [Vicinamibacterales bacterium]|nr:SLC13 family permease [Vicinamibacterales bacterium]
MNLAWLSLGALVIAMIVSCFSTLNVGVLALALAWIVGVYLGSMSLNDVLSGFPVQLFLTLAGVTLMFTQAQLNGTLDRVAHAAVRVCRGNAGLIPVMFFVLGSIIASLGPGNVATAAMLAPMAMAVATRAAIPPFLMAIMVGNGAQSGALSPVAPTGIIVTGLMDKIGLGGFEMRTYIANLLAHAIIAFGGYVLLGGLKLFKNRYTGGEQDAESTRLIGSHWMTLAVIGVVLVFVLFFNANIGMAAFTGAVVLAALRVADHEQAIRKMPWIPILMVSGVSVLVALLEKTGGLDLFTEILAKFATPGTLTGVIAFVTGVISVYSSTSGVVLPAFLPTVPGLIARLGGDPFGVASSMNIGAHLVDMSPLSTTGAMCIAGISDPEQVRQTYNKLLVWGLSMTVIGAIGCYI